MRCRAEANSQLPLYVFFLPLLIAFSLHTPRLHFISLTTKTLCYNITVESLIVIVFLTMTIRVLTPQALQAQLHTAERLCKQRNKRLTPLRRKVLELLIRAERGLKAYELLEQIQADHPNAAPPTVYRALDFLTEQELIHRLDAVNAWSACVDAAGKPHDLFVVCTNCRQVVELHAPDLSEQLAHCIALAGFSFDAQETELRALCNDCVAA